MDQPRPDSAPNSTPAQPADRLTFAAFYPTYLADHARPATRLFHVAGTLALFASVGLAIAWRNPLWVLAGIAAAYAAAWVSHFAIERNRPATFRRPWYSVLADLRMTVEILTFRRPLDERGDAE